MVTSDRSDTPDFMPPFNASLTLFYELISPNEHLGRQLNRHFNVENPIDSKELQVSWGHRSNEASFLQDMGVRITGRLLEVSTTFDSMIYRGQGAFWAQQRMDEWVSKILDDYSGFVSAMTLAAEWGWITWSEGKLDYMILDQKKRKKRKLNILEKYAGMCWIDSSLDELEEKVDTVFND
jgi:hypothetical protein